VKRKFFSIQWLSVLLSVAFSVLLLFLTVQEARADWLSGYSYRKKITIDNTNVDSDLSNFPLYVYLDPTGSGASLGAKIQDSGQDIRFTDNTGATLLKHEIESYAEASGNVTADLWVKVPTVNNASTTVIYMYYGNTSAVDGQDAENVWDSSFTGVWHMPDGTTLSGVDSTSNNKDGSVTGASAVSAKINGGGSWDGSVDYISLTSYAITSSNTQTFSIWVNPDSTQQNSVFGRLPTNSGHYASYGFGIILNSDDTFRVTASNNNSEWWDNITLGTATISDWNHVVFTISGNGASNTGKLYVNGTLADSHTGTTSFYASYLFAIGASCYTPATFGQYFVGDIDEARIASDVRTADEIKFEYNNINESDQEALWGSEEGWLAGWLYRKEITIDDTNVDGDLTDFPLYIYLDPTGSGASLGAKIQDSGQDIRFTQSDGTTLLKHEIESYAEASGNVTASIWTKVPSILASGGATIYMYYGSNSAADGQDAANVWDDNFKGIWHMDDNAANSTVTDSTGTNNGTYKDSGGAINTSTGSNSSGQVNSALDFDGGDEYVDIDSAQGDLASSTAGTWTAWVKPTDATPSSAEIIIGFGDTNANTQINIRVATDGTFASTVKLSGTNRWVLDTDAAAFSDGTWTHIAIVQNGTEPVLYADGVAVAQTFSTSTDKADWFNDLSGIDNGRIGDLNRNSAGEALFFTGIIDEARISNDDRSADWIKFEYNNINESDQEASYASEEEGQPLVGAAMMVD